MRRKRINFGSDFCGDVTCNICFANAAEAEAEYNEEFEIERLVGQRIRVPLEKPKPKPDVSAGIVLCPRCGMAMVVRVNRNTQQEFWGCRQFPDCRGTRPKARTEPVKPATVKAATAPQITKPFNRPNLRVENEATIKGKLTVLQNEAKPEVPAPVVQEPVKEVSFADLMSRSTQHAYEEGIKTSGDFLPGAEHIIKEDKKKERT